MDDYLLSMAEFQLKFLFIGIENRSIDFQLAIDVFLEIKVVWRAILMPLEMRLFTSTIQTRRYNEKFQDVLEARLSRKVLHGHFVYFLGHVWYGF